MTIRRRTELSDYLAFRAAGSCDVGDVQRVRLPAGLVADPAALAEAVFDLRRAPRAILALFGLRQLLVPVLGIPRTTSNPFRVREVRDGEALIATTERHLTFWCSVGEREGCLEVATAVQLAGWRGRLYWLVVAPLHGLVTRAMMRGAVRRIVGGEPLG